MRRIAALVLTLALAGCAHRGPAVQVSGSERLHPGASYFLVGSEPDGATAPPQLSERVASALEAAGLVRAATADAAVYLVQVSFANRPARLGAYASIGDGDKAGASPVWRVSAVKRRPWNLLRRNGDDLTLDIVEHASGRDVRRISISRYGWASRPAVAQAELVAALADALKGGRS